jgi:hypothetical protein
MMARRSSGFSTLKVISLSGDEVAIGLNCPTEFHTRIKQCLFRLAPKGIREYRGLPGSIPQCDAARSTRCSTPSRVAEQTELHLGPPAVTFPGAPVRRPGAVLKSRRFQ